MTIPLPEPLGAVSLTMEGKPLAVPVGVYAAEQIRKYGDDRVAAEQRRAKAPHSWAARFAAAPEHSAVCSEEDEGQAAFCAHDCPRRWFTAGVRAALDDIAPLTDIPQELHTGEVWAAIREIRVQDPDGWRGEGKHWDDVIAEEEFERRLAPSTVQTHKVPRREIEVTTPQGHRYLYDHDAGHWVPVHHSGAMAPRPWSSIVAQHPTYETRVL